MYRNIQFCFLLNYLYAPVAELADALDLGSSVPDVKVQVLSGAPNKNRNFDTKLRFCFLPEKPLTMEFLKEEKFRCNKCRTKIEAFSATAHKFRLLRNFSSKDNAPLLA